MQWRLTLDVPYDFAIENGFARGVHCADFKPEAGSFNNTWRDPVTGLVMLKPTWQNRDYNTDFVTFDSFRKQAAFWRNTKRSSDLTSTFANVKPAGSDVAGINININTALTILNSIAGDTLYWAAESNFALEIDEGFSLEWHSITDEMLRLNNWFSVSWDQIQLHFSYQGFCRVYKLNRADLTIPGTLVHEFQYANPGELLNRHMYFRFLPIPTQGVLFYFREPTPKGDLFNSTVGHGAVSRGHLIPWDSYEHPDGTGSAHLLERSTVKIALNPKFVNNIGFDSMRFAASGTYIDGKCDPGYQPTVAPSSVPYSVLPTNVRTVTTEFRKPDDSAAWVPGVDRPGRVKATLATTDTRYTPFLVGLGVFIDPVFKKRNTTPLVLDREAKAGDTLHTLEFSQDAMGRFEGKATMLLSSAAGRKIAERGDATFLLENRATSGDAWATVEGGLAVDWTREFCYTNGQFYYMATACLRDMYERLNECHMVMQTYCDSISVADNLNTTLSCSGLPRLKSIPPEALAKKLPPVVPGQTWSHGPREGESHEEIVRNLLLFMRTQYIEWRMRWDWTNATFVLEKRARDTVNFWTLSPKRSDENAGTRTWSYGDGAVSRPVPPEANVLIVEGKTSASGQAYRLMSTPIKNEASVSDPTSPDYLGRVKCVTAVMSPIAVKEMLNEMVRRYEPTAMHRSDRIDPMPVWKYQPLLVPNTEVKVKDDQGTVIFDGWIHRITVECDQDDKETMSLALDTVWETDIQ